VAPDLTRALHLAAEVQVAWLTDMLERMVSGRTKANER
jgi:hypothetical protein